MNIVSFNYTVSQDPLDALERIDAPDFAGKVARLSRRMAAMEQADLPLKHHFSPGLYLREIFMPAGTVVVGKIHKTEHFNILVKGACWIIHDDFSREELRAPAVFVSKAGVQKVLCIIEDMIWMTTHVTEETDLVKLEQALVTPMLLENLS
ncbi:MAG TPA: hypothetical protein VK626_01545 [Nitrospiraceae bacterium]|nr:hypothetical protein [Nitrospiraceae bacterium]